MFNKLISGMIFLTNKILPTVRMPDTNLYSIYRKSQERRDTTDFIPAMFYETFITHPKLIVELGVRGGDSTYALSRAAEVFGAKLISVDITDCRNVSDYWNWEFVLSDAIEFIRRSKIRNIDVLLIDTSHKYEHTKQEIRHYFKRLSKNALVMFHDTNPSKIYRRKNGSFGYSSRANTYGVSKAIEEFFGKHFTWDIEFIDYVNGWIIKHYPHSSGFTIIRKIKT